MINPAMYLLIAVVAIIAWLSLSSEWESLGKEICKIISELFKKEEE